MKINIAKCIAVIALFGLVALALPADVDADDYSIGGLVKRGASGQAYTWSPGGC